MTTPHFYWKLWLDDLQPPPRGTWIHLREPLQAIKYCMEHGAPTYVSFDDYLGVSVEPIDFALFLVRRDVELVGKFLPEAFDFDVHGKNPVWGQAIRACLNNHLSKKQ